ncbi:ADC synthase [Phyllosticta capitalensis]
MAKDDACHAPRILFLDAYDSFANNIVALLRQAIGADVTTIHIDDPRFLGQEPSKFSDFLSGYDAVVAGPGPGTVTNSGDVGLISRLWTLPSSGQELPVLGICLGFQSLAHAYGASISKLPEPRHGIITRVLHQQSSIFQDVGDVHATQYHSLRVDLQHFKPTTELWKPSQKCPKLRPVAWDLDSTMNGPVLMAVEHLVHPFWGVQYHPESICTNPAGAQIIRNWWQQATKWLNTRTRKSCTVLHERFTATTCDVKNISSLLGLPSGQTIILESGLNSKKEPIRAETGSHSVLCCLDPEGRSLRLEYYVQNQILQLWCGDELLYNQPIVDVWAYLKDLSERCRTHNGPAEVPFWGGLAGIVSYEAGLETINVHPKVIGARGGRRPDILFAFVLRSIVVNHVEQTIHVQSIEGDDKWVHDTTINKTSRKALTALLHRASITTPPRPSYTSKVATCHHHIRAGNSYELCLTAPTSVQLPRTQDSSHSLPWQLYTRLRRLNPAPFGAYIRLAGATVVSSSPERFLSWTRGGRCQFRPIKGTVKKTRQTASGQIETVDRGEAERILGSAKERAENLMIVDLVRHDLHGVAGAGNVWVSKLMGVEEYETVWQLVSVVEGQLGMDGDGQKKKDCEAEGVALLRASLPPGSMTGAPKKRSCELLQDLEDIVPRGVYSGVMGYLDVGGGGDFAVVIRTAFRWDERHQGHDETIGKSEDGGQTFETWTVGAGGAVTAQSDPDAEYDEMRVKLDSIMRMFDPAVVVDDDDED